MDGYNHYIRIDANNRIFDGYADWQTEKRAPDEILILEDGPRHFHEVWTESLYTSRGQLRFKWEGERVERSQGELDTEWSARPPAPKSDIDELKSTQADILLAMVMNDLM